MGRKAAEPPAVMSEMPLLLRLKLSRGAQRLANAKSLEAGADVQLARSVPAAFRGYRSPEFWRVTCGGRVGLPLSRPPPARAAPSGGQRTVPPPARKRVLHVEGDGDAEVRLVDAQDETVAGAMAGKAVAALQALRAGRITIKTRAVLASDSLPSYEAEALGGPASLRGYDIAELGRANSVVSGTIELGVPVAQGMVRRRPEAPSTASHPVTVRH